MAELLERLRDGGRPFHARRVAGAARRRSRPRSSSAIQSATTGLPYALCRQNMQKIEAAMRNMAAILDGLTGGLDLAVLDAGYGQRDGHTVSFAPRARRFGAVLPANSPGVHALWLPALALKMPLALKPGQREPWTPLRILEAMRRAGRAGGGAGILSLRARRGGRDPAAVAGRRCSLAPGRRCGRGSATRGSRSTARATARSCSGRTRPARWERATSS